MVIDPTDYAISVRPAEAGVQQAKADMQNPQREAKRRQDLPPVATTIKEQQTYETQRLPPRRSINRLWPI
jgi:multidrug resistance efflux pump